MAHWFSDFWLADYTVEELTSLMAAEETDPVERAEAIKLLDRNGVTLGMTWDAVARRVEELLRTRHPSVATAMAALIAKLRADRRLFGLRLGISHATPHFDVPERRGSVWFGYAAYDIYSSEGYWLSMEKSPLETKSVDHVESIKLDDFSTTLLAFLEKAKTILEVEGGNHAR